MKKLILGLAVVLVCGCFEREIPNLGEYPVECVGGCEIRDPSKYFNLDPVGANYDKKCLDDCRERVEKAEQRHCHRSRWEYEIDEACLEFCHAMNMTYRFHGTQDPYTGHMDTECFCDGELFYEKRYAYCWFDGEWFWLVEEK